MYSEKSHPLLAQVPLTVSPFINLPTAITLPYTYKPLPSTLPPSSTADANGVEREKYVVSASGHAASPEDIIASCQGLQAHIKKTQEDAEIAINDWEASLKEEELAEKRRVAPGWLDRTEKILEPEKKAAGATPSNAPQAPDGITNVMDSQDTAMKELMGEHSVQDAAGHELDRAFGTCSRLAFRLSTFAPVLSGHIYRSGGAFSMEYPTPVTPENPYFNTKVPSQYALSGVSADAYRQHESSNLGNFAFNMYSNTHMANTNQQFGYYQNGPLGLTPNTPLGGQPIIGGYQNGGYQVFDTSNIPIDPALSSLPAPVPCLGPSKLLPAMSQAAPAPRPSLQRVPLLIRGTTFDLNDQRLIVYAMSFLGYKADQLAPIFGLDGNGDPRISANVVRAAHEYLEAGKIYQGNSELWQRNDEVYKAQIDVKLHFARGKQCKLQVEKMKLESMIKEDKTRRVAEQMDKGMKNEQAFFEVQLRKGV